MGLKDGSMIIVDIASGDVIETIPAHKSELWSIVLYPNLVKIEMHNLFFSLSFFVLKKKKKKLFQKGVASGGGDKTVKFWDFELIEEAKSETRAKVLSLIHTRTLKLEENVLCVRISPNNKFVAVSLLDSTVKIFFLDTFKVII